MNAPDRLAFSSVLGALSMSYSPLIDRARRAFGIRLTMLSVKPQDRLPVGLMLDQLGMLWPTRGKDGFEYEYVERYICQRVA